MELKLSSIETKNLSKKNITEICKLKNTFWKFSIKNQLLWFKKNIRYLILFLFLINCLI